MTETMHYLPLLLMLAAVFRHAIASVIFFSSLWLKSISTILFLLFRENKKKKGKRLGCDGNIVFSNHCASDGRLTTMLRTRLSQQPKLQLIIFHWTKMRRTIRHRPPDRTTQTQLDYHYWLNFFFFFFGKNRSTSNGMSSKWQTIYHQMRWQMSAQFSRFQ